MAYTDLNQCILTETLKTFEVHQVPMACKYLLVEDYKPSDHAKKGCASSAQCTVTGDHCPKARLRYHV